ncbi:hypothetical protein [Novosphingobium sp. BW1]|uniref:hypothetical protein n=1 Tax=Novosphingobium sp. BW1 TaxID=2592621 RepID=UPI0011DEC348|nr:hypothetical protein [Novosphingobium sp. BW1]TYC93015.1 hypothetical protein FMM79_03235 [Novosphingobium sp. BW1]
MSIDDAVDLQRLVDIETCTRKNLAFAQAEGNCARAAHFSRRLQTLDLTISRRSLGMLHVFE